VDHRFIVGRFISLGRIVEETREDYYRVLKTCSTGWPDRNEVLPWWNYFLTIVRRAYVEFADNVDRGEPHSGKSNLVEQAAPAMVGDFTLAELHAQLPSVSLPTIKKVLLELKSAGKLKLIGRGRGARWQVL